MAARSPSNSTGTSPHGSAPAPQWVPESIPAGADPACGAEILQLTSQPVISTNIYCEQRFASADGSRIAISREPFGRPPEIWVCDLGSLRLCQAAYGHPIGANARRNAVYYIDAREPGGCLMRLDLQDLSVRVLHTFADAPPPRVGAVSGDERWFVGGPHPVSGRIHALTRTDLTSGRHDVLCEMEDIVNPHLQFDPADGGRLLVQINRGAVPARSHTAGKLAGNDGATLATIALEEGIPRFLPVGRPCTPLLSGHECWAGESGGLVFTTAPVAPPEELPRIGVYHLAPGAAAATSLTPGRPFNHIAASDDGRFFIVDDYHTRRIFIGSIHGGAPREICHSQTRQGAPQYTHAHPYMTPGNRHIIFNSNQSGITQVYAARIPEDFLRQF